MALHRSTGASDRIRGRELMLELLSGKTDFKGIRIFEEGFNFTSDRTFGLLVEYFKSREFGERKNRVNLEAAQLNDAKAPGFFLPYLLARGINFNFADITGADFNNADFRRAGFKRAKLARVNLSNAYLTGAIFSDADMSEADLSEAMANDVNMLNTNLARANLRGTRLKNARLDNACLENADLTGADLSGASLVRVNLRGANLDRAIFTGAIVQDLIIDAATRAAGAVHLNLNVQLRRPGDDEDLPPPPPPPPPREDRDEDFGAPLPPPPPRPAEDDESPAPAPPLKKKFSAQVVLDASRVGLDAIRVAEKVIAPLMGVKGADMRVALNIDAKIAGGVPEDVARAVMEGCRILKIDAGGFSGEID